MLEVYKGLGSTGSPSLIAFCAKNWTSMKAPVEIELRRASFTLSQLGKGAGLGEEDLLGSKAGTSSGPTIPFHIMARVSATRVNCDRDKPAIFFRSSFLVALSVLAPDSSLILPTSRETCTADISGKLCNKSEHLRIVRTSGSQRGETGKHLVHDITVRHVVVDVCFGLLLEGWYIVLRLMRHGTPNTSKASYHVCESVNRLGGRGWEPRCTPIFGLFSHRELATRVRAERSELYFPSV